MGRGEPGSHGVTHEGAHRIHKLSDIPVAEVIALCFYPRCGDWAIVGEPMQTREKSGGWLVDPTIDKAKAAAPRLAKTMAAAPAMRPIRLVRAANNPEPFFPAIDAAPIF
jgi:hypothetical protein